MGLPIRLTLKDGTALEQDPWEPWTAREQIAWEEHFKSSFITVFRALNVDRQVAEEDPDSTAREYQIRWVLWFAWHRLRPKVANRFSVFVDEQLDDWEWVFPPEEDGTVEKEPEEPPAVDHGDGSLDPTPEVLVASTPGP